MNRDDQIQMTKKQAKFLRAVRDQACLMDEVVGQMHLKPFVVGNWFGKKRFRRALARIAKKNKRQGKLEFDMTVTRAVRVMARLLAGDPSLTDLQRQTAFNLLALEFGRPKPRRVNIKALKAPPPPPAPLIHPDVSPEEALIHIQALQAEDAVKDAGNSTHPTPDSGDDHVDA